ncbi:TRAP transporter substrate-binding protein [Ammoniphilus resinae]|uniref:Tripartite ATP-independent transporter DctP family solute receptor n=1 Tax=Ammoniphilus resinae TaxID=861532 RepID=A0ABS4GPQ6_9BACL|nr:TRAP transporter substrate-binding protein [Ammoniphilus resinae]MBP1932252.1 tripartite ATP-independent transporter DctP family solute receptor [Ammoniphilus resinae]
MKKWFKSVSAVMLASSLLVVSACGGSPSSSEGGSGGGSAEPAPKADDKKAGGEVIEWDMPSVYAEGSAPVKGAQKFAELLDQKSNGQIKVTVFPNGSLGTERENFEALKAGDVELILAGYQGQDMYAPEFMFISAPFLFKSMDHVKAVLNGDLGKKMFAKMDESDSHALGSIIRGPRHMTANKEIKTPEDVKGLKLRLPEIEAWVAAWKAFDTLATPVALPELYGALQTGVVEASEGPTEQFYTFKLQEVQKYMIKTSHIYEATFFWINKPLWDSLTPEQQKWVQEASDEAIAYANDEAEKDAVKFEKEMVDAGMTVVEPDRDKFVELAQPALKEFFETKWTVTNLDEINSYAK